MEGNYGGAEGGNKVVGVLVEWITKFICWHKAAAALVGGVHLLSHENRTPISLKFKTITVYIFARKAPNEKLTNTVTMDGESRFPSNGPSKCLPHSRAWAV